MFRRLHFDFLVINYPETRVICSDICHCLTWLLCQGLRSRFSFMFFFKLFFILVWMETHHVVKTDFNPQIFHHVAKTEFRSFSEFPRSIFLDPWRDEVAIFTISSFNLWYMGQAGRVPKESNINPVWGRGRITCNLKCALCNGLRGS